MRSRLFAVSLLLTACDGGNTLTTDGTNFVKGSRILELPSLPSGEYLLQVILLGARVERVASRTTAITVRENTSVTVLITRVSRACDEETCARRTRRFGVYPS